MGDSKRTRRATPKAKLKSAAPDPMAAADLEAPGALSFEGALEQLEGAVARLEGGEMPLEEALELFETGIKLSRQCSSTLEAAERRIEVLMADRSDAKRAGGAEGAWRAEPFDAAPIDEAAQDDLDDDEEEDFEE